jgi:glucan endo-1,3-beta-D-glucosidase
LIFALPPPSNPTFAAPYTILAPGGIGVSRLARSADGRTSANPASGAASVGSVPRLMPGKKYTIASAPCEAGQMVGYRIDSASGLNLDFFQMTSPALGLFIEVV